MIHHHPGDDLLLARAAGDLAHGHALLLDVHAEGCARCRARLGQLEAVGGALLDALEPVPLAPEAFAATLARLDAFGFGAGAAAAGGAASLPFGAPPLPPGAAWPRALAGCEMGRWRWLARGMQWSRVRLANGAGGNVFALRIQAGCALPSHRHSASEFTQVLHGSFDDGRSTFAPGDFDATDASIRHEPTARAGSDCVCLVSLSGKVVFDGTVAKLWGALNGI